MLTKERNACIYKREVLFYKRNDALTQSIINGKFIILLGLFKLGGWRSGF